MNSNWNTPSISDPRDTDETSLTELPRVPLLCDVTELATILKVPVKTIYYWVHRKQIPFIKMGRHLRFKPEEVVAAFSEKTAEQSAPCIRRSGVIKRSGNRSLKIRDANPVPEKE